MSAGYSMVSMVLLLGTAVLSGVSGECKDKLSNCNFYSVDACKGSYLKWALEHCRRRCGLCNNEPSSGSTNEPTSAGSTCTQKGKSYRKGETWIEDCKTGRSVRYTCVDPSTNNIKAKSLCWHWGDDMVLSYCHMIAPGPGKCCPQPWCDPKKMTIVYPPNYQIN